jgi:hypothetical protein
MDLNAAAVSKNHAFVAAQRTSTLTSLPSPDFDSMETLPLTSGRALHANNANAEDRFRSDGGETDTAIFDGQSQHFIHRVEVDKNFWRLGMFGSVAQRLQRDMVDRVRNFRSRRRAN